MCKYSFIDYQLLNICTHYVHLLGVKWFNLFSVASKTFYCGVTGLRHGLMVPWGLESDT